MLLDVSLGDAAYYGVIIPQNMIAIADVHTHPRCAQPKMSGPIYVNWPVGCKGICQNDGDMNTDLNRHIDGYVFRVGGGEWHFNRLRFLKDAEKATLSGAVLDSEWPQYMERLK